MENYDENYQDYYSMVNNNQSPRNIHKRIIIIIFIIIITGGALFVQHTVKQCQNIHIAYSKTIILKYYLQKKFICYNNFKRTLPVERKNWTLEQRKVNAVFTLAIRALQQKIFTQNLDNIILIRHTPGYVFKVLEKYEKDAWPFNLFDFYGKPFVVDCGYDGSQDSIMNKYCDPSSELRKISDLSQEEQKKFKVNHIKGTR